MKKLWITLLISLCFVSGCSITRVSYESVNSIFETILYAENNLINTHMDGYSLYLPKGVSIIDKSDYNLKIRDNRNYYYLYIDTIAYHYKVSNSFVEKTDHFFSQTINFNGKNGYIDIVDKGDKYFIVVMFNYAKLESYVAKKDFNEAMMTICSILSSIKYNDSVISGYADRNKNLTQEERFNIFDSNIENDNFLKYESEYGTYKEKIDIGKDNEVINVDETIE